ncbi:unnamed protein product [Musa acuminata subsp. burmannicoides]
MTGKERSGVVIIGSFTIELNMKKREELVPKQTGTGWVISSHFCRLRNRKGDETKRRPSRRAAHFAAIHKVFGASNASKLLLQLPVSNRPEAALTISYEAQARLQDPVYGCVSHIFALQQQILTLEAQLASLKAQTARGFGNEDEFSEKLPHHRQGDSFLRPWRSDAATNPQLMPYPDDANKQGIYQRRQASNAHNGGNEFQKIHIEWSQLGKDYLRIGQKATSWQAAPLSSAAKKTYIGRLLPPQAPHSRPTVAVGLDAGNLIAGGTHGEDV